MFTAHSQPLAAGRRTVEMTQTPVSAPATRRSRPGPLLLGKDQPFESFTDLALLDDERVLVAGAGPLITSVQGVQVRRWPDLQVERTLPAGGRCFDVRAPSLLAGGPLWEGRCASGVWMELSTGRVHAEFPVAPPFLITEDGFLGWLRRRFDFETDPSVDPALVRPWPALAGLIDTHRSLLVSCSWKGRVHWQLDVASFAPEFTDVKALARGPAGDTVFVATERSLAEVELATGRVRGSRSWNDAPGGDPLNHTSVAVDAHRVAVGGWSGGRVATLRVLDRTGQRVLHEGGASDKSAIECLAWSGGTLLAGTRSGLVLLFDDAFTRREVRLGRSAVNQLLAVRGGVLAACGQRELRFLPLLDDET